MIAVRTSNTAVAILLARHHGVSRIEPGPANGLSFESDGRDRQVLVGNPGAEVFGLMELMDNNPVVCADSVSVPSSAGTLSLVALGPLASAGLLGERPNLVLSVPSEDSDIAASLSSAGFHEGANLHVELQDLGGVAAATAMAAIPTPSDPTEIVDLYEERFGRSLFVRGDQLSPWVPELAAGKPVALYRVELALDSELSLVTVRAMADLNGKCGATQLVHAFNVMCGFDEAAGIA